MQANQVLLYILIFLFLQTFITYSHYAQEIKTETIYLGSFYPVNNKPDPKIEEEIRNKLTQTLQNSNFKVIALTDSLEKDLKQANQNKAHIYISGFYRRKPNGNLVIYANLYNPETQKMYDALEQTDSLGGDFEIDLKDLDIKEPDEEIIDKFVKKLSVRIKVNKSKKENFENIDSFVNSPAYSKNQNLPLPTESGSSVEQVFKLLEDIEVVTATRSKTKLREAPAAVYVITAAQIRERGYQTLSEALHDMPGFDFQHTYGIYPEQVHQRGLVGENNRTLVYIDGVPDNNLNENGALAGTIRFPLANVERIEIVSGPASALYGANAFNGIINIITKDGKTASGNHIEFTHGYWERGFRNKGYRMSFSSRDEISLGKDGKSIQYSLGGYYYITEGPYFGGISNLQESGYQRRINQNSLEYYAQNKFCGGVCVYQNNNLGHFWSPFYNNSREDTYNITAKVQRGGLRFETINWQYLQGEGTFANGNHQIDTKMKGLETGKFDTRNLARLYGMSLGVVGPQGFTGSQWDFKNNTAMVGYLHEFTNRLSLDTELLVRSTQILSSSHEEYPDTKAGTGGAAKSNGYRNANTTTPYAYYQPGNVTLEASYSRPDYSYQLEERLQFNQSDKMNTIVGLVAKHFVVAKDYGSHERFTFNAYAAYLQQVIKPVSMLSITLGYRYDYNTIYGKASNPRIGIVYQPTSALTLKFLAGFGFREPTAKELFSQTAQRKPNPDLKPEKLRAYEIGAGYRFSKNYYSSLQAYQNTITDLILEVATTDSNPIGGRNPSGGFWRQNQNLGVAKIQGVELDNTFQILDNLSFYFNYTYNKGIYEKLPATLQNSPSTEGRETDNPFWDMYAEIYRQLTITPSTPRGRRTSPPKGAIPNIAPHKVNLGFTWYIVPKLSLYVGLRFVDIRRNRATNPERSTPGYTMLKINLRKEDFFLAGMFLQLTINNATNQQFFDPGIRDAAGSYYPTMHPLERRNYWLSVGYNF